MDTSDRTGGVNTPVNTRINLEQSRRMAKDLPKDFSTGHPRARDRVRWNHPRLRKLSDAEITLREFALAVSANGAEDYRQVAAPNIVDITRFLLVGARTDFYPGMQAGY